ncbi:GNAT family N-acetyltransferase [Paenibacillus shunpengii]|uniref:GNAT family N-acetyltransferase n=1 Tax=Paenibacillus shunpengii TaxID=2054424 RepID=A0ABW5SPK0_9BACL
MNVDQLFETEPEFETSKLLLRKITMDDTEAYYELASDPAVATYTLWDKHQSITDSRAFISRLIQKYSEKEAYHWGIIDKAKNKLIGRTGFIQWDLAHERTEIGFALSRLYWNQGIITEATRLIIEYGFTHLGFNRIEGRCSYNNAGSARAMEKLGMKWEGILRGQLKMKGEFVDQRMYAILRDDFDSVNNSSTL